jgi:hypothetical protein
MPFVTSIWRVLARDEPALASTWNATRPFVRPFEVAARLHAIAVPEVSRLDPEDVDRARIVIASYTRANSIVLAALSAACSGAPASMAPKSVDRVESAGPLPRLREREERPERELAAVDSLDAIGAASSRAPLHAAVWRHAASAVPSCLVDLVRSPAKSHEGGREMVGDLQRQV